MQSLRRTWAVLWTDCVLRFRKTSTLVTFLLLCFFAYIWVPDPAGGTALLVVGGQRALYNSDAVAFATALLCSMFTGLFGFYLVSQSIQLDIRTRCGTIIASTPTSSWQYLLGKCLGNMLFLGTLALGFLLSCMAMQLVRGEAPLEPGTFLRQYFIFLPPAISFVSVVAILFESTPRLAGKLGDVCYFFLWTLVLAGGIAAHESGAVNASSYLDFTGVTLIAETLGPLEADKGSVSIGAAPFDQSKPPLVFEGVEFGPKWLAPRLGSFLAPFPLLLLAIAFFHRFDPTRSRMAASRQRVGITRRLNTLLKPLFGIGLPRLMTRGNQRATLFSSMRADASLTLLNNPMGGLAMAVAIPASLLVPSRILFGGVLPVVFAALAMLLAGVSSREHRNGTHALISSAPGLREHFVWWKLGSAVLVGLGFTMVAIGRLGLTSPGEGLSVLVGMIFTATSATALGILTNTPKAFLVLFLVFWYAVLNSGGQIPLLAFGGLYGPMDGWVQALYLGLGATLLLLAHLVYRRRLL